jgi:glycosyltransferase involved in cell wall biosynthesis
MKYALVMPVLNELEGLKVILPRIKKDWLDEIVIVDGGSQDGSIEYAQSLGFNVTPQKEKGLIAGIREGIQVTKSDVIIGFTPDNNMIPEKIPELIKKMEEGYDMVIVSRYLAGAKSYDDTIVSGFGNWLFTMLVNLFFRTNYTDVLGFFRAYRKDLLKELNINEIPLSIDTLLCIRCKKYKKRVAEIPGDEPPRIGGKSSRSIVGNGIIELKTILSEFINQ